jgi:acyl-CoA thioesterase I
VGCRLPETPEGKFVDPRRIIHCATLHLCRLARRVGAWVVCSLILMAVAAPRVWADTPCPIPDAMALHDISLPAARHEVVTEQRLIVLTFGGVRPAGADAVGKGATWPARLQAALSAALPEIRVTVANEPAPGRTSADVPAALPGLLAKTGARLVIWGPGGRDVAAHLDPGVFQAAVNGGIEAVRHGGADLILLDTTFVPSPARMVQIEPFRDRLLEAARTGDVPVLRRHGLMRLWGEDGTLNLAARDPAEREAVVRHLFSCVAQGLAGAIAAAVR